MSDTPKPLLLVDGSSYLYRAFHAMFKQDLRNSKGFPTGAARTVVSMLKRLEKDYPGSDIVVVFDAKGKTFRDEIYPEYKANRPPMPDDLRLQIEPLHAIVKALGMPLLMVDGVEADDVIGTLARQATERKMDVVVSTGDKDLAQLVNHHITLVDTMKEQTLDRAGVEEKFGLPPELIIDYLALRGDSSDNIPGVPGVGEKTALALLQNLGGIDQVYQRLDEVAGLGFRGSKTMATKLEAHKDSAYLSYELATIKTDVDMGISVEALKQSPPDTAALRKLYSEMEFRSWLSELDQGPAEDEVEEEAENVEIAYETVLDTTRLEQWVEQLQQAECFAVDTETTSLNYMEAEIVGVSFCIEAGKAAYVPFGHDYLGAPKQLEREQVLTTLQPILESPKIKKIGQNIKYDASVLANHGIQLQGMAYDTMLESYVFNAISGRHDMDSLAETHLKHSTVHFEDIAGKGSKQLTFNQIDLEQAGPYASEDADITLRLHHRLWPKVAKQPGPKRVFEELEMPLVSVLSKIERQGAKIDSAKLAQQSADHEKRMVQLKQEAYDIAGEEFNLGSPKQLGHILFEKLHLPVIKKTKTKQASTAEEVLQELALDYPLPKVIMDYRMLSKLKSTYTDKLPQMINAKTGRVHTSYQQAVAATGRLSSTDPNLQNIPIKTEEGRRIRQAFVAEKGYKILAADYSQIELRIMAHLSDDPGLKKAFSEGLDVHKHTAAEVFGMALDSVTSEQRRSAKAINFGLIYGMSAFGLARQLRIGRRDAQQYIDTYFERYPGVAQYMDAIKGSATEQGYVETLMGRRLYLPDINASNGMKRQAAQRIAINAPMQGTAADIIKKAMIDVDAWLSNSKLDATMIMQVHDELVLEVAEDCLDEVQNTLCELMCHAVSLKVPLLVEAGVGDNWDEAH